ncbi:hypothetical protein [Moellerella wisconsensis]|uniref:hypothetical protein n=1 Tax=Moellerella wisconsensis TaxID=158849 RepID=UPI0024100B4B|nr:hypothetical protein [Moellerella wisconsensis]
MKKALIGLFILMVGFNAYAEDPLSKKEINWLKSTNEAKELGCDSFSNRVYSKITPLKIEKEKSIFDNQKVFSNSQFVCAVGMNYKNNTYTMSIVEVVNINGVNAQIYHSNGSGGVGNGDSTEKESWLFGCSKDKMNDEITCYLNNNDLYVYKDKNGYLISIGRNHFPSKDSFIRVNEEAPIKSGEKGYLNRNKSNLLMSKLSSKDAVTTRYVEWPYDRNKDSEVGMVNFDAAKQVVNKVFDNYH